MIREAKSLDGRKNTHKVLMSILVSYIVILIVSVGCWIVMMKWIRAEMEEQNEVNYTKVLEILANSMDKELQIVDRQALGITLSGETKSMLASFAGNGKDILQVKKVMDNLAAGMKNQNVMSSCYLYILNRDYVVAYNTTANADIYFQTYIQNTGVSFQDWTEFIYGISRNGYCELKTENASLLYYAYLEPINTTRKNAVLLIQISADSILGESGQGEQLASIGVEVTTDNGIVVVPCADKQEDGQVITVQSDTTGWYYRGYVGNGDFNGNLKKLTWYLMMGIIISAGVCMLVLTISLRTHYVPLKNILKSLEQVRHEGDQSDNAYKYITESLNDLISRQKQEQMDLKLQSGKLREVYLQYLFSGRCHPEYIKEADLTFFELEFVPEGFYLVFFATGKGREACQGISLEKTGISYLGEHLFRGIYAGVREKAAGYFFSEADAEILMEKVPQMLQNVIEQKEVLQIYVSGFHRGGNDIYLAWSEVMQMRKDTFRNNQTGIFTYEEFCREKKQNTIKEDMLQYIAAHYSNPDLSVESVCAALNKSVSTVNKLMKELGEEGPLYYINEKRIQEAKRIFQESKGNQNVKNVMQQVGIENPGTFIRIFKKYVGVTPSEYQKLCQNGMDVQEMQKMP